MELVLFKDLLEDDAEPQYGLLEDRDEPSVICLCCGSAVEFGDYEIIERLPWQDLSSAVKQSKKNRYVVCMNESYVRDAQRVNSDELSHEEFDEIDFYDLENDDMWMDMEPVPFIDIVEADSEEEACKIAGEVSRYDYRLLFAIQI